MGLLVRLDQKLALSFSMDQINTDRLKDKITVQNESMPKFSPLQSIGALN